MTRILCSSGTTTSWAFSRTECMHIQYPPGMREMWITTSAFTHVGLRSIGRLTASSSCGAGAPNLRRRAHVYLRTGVAPPTRYRVAPDVNALTSRKAECFSGVRSNSVDVRDQVGLLALLTTLDSPLMEMRDIILHIRHRRVPPAARAPAPRAHCGLHVYGAAEKL